MPSIILINCWHFIINNKFYSKSLRLGLRDGSFDKKPKKNKDIKNITIVYTKIFNVNIFLSLKL
jgi:hypothetical protein